VVVLLKPQQLLLQETLTDKYIGFDIDSKKTVACIVQKGEKDRYTTFKTDIGQMKSFLQRQRRQGEKLNLTFEVSGQSGYLSE